MVAKSRFCLGPANSGSRKSCAGNKVITGLGGGPASVRLYSRDDVWGPLRLQQHIVASLRSGWRPLTPQARGALPPLEEPPVELSKERVAALPLTVSSSPGIATPPSPGRCDPAPSSSEAKKDGEPLINSDETSSSGSSASSSASGEKGSASSRESSPSQRPEVGTNEDGLLINLVSGVYHAALPAAESTPARRRISLGGRTWRAACGALLTQPDGSYTIAAAAPWTTEPCCRGPCSRRLEGAPRDVPASS